MMFFLLSCLSTSTTTADIFPPFALDSRNRIGYWELGGKAYSNDDTIVVVPPIQFRKGSMWTDVAIPSEDWTIDFNMQIPQTNGGGFGIWFVNKYGAEGDLHGGPNSFNGIGIVNSVVRLEDGTFGLATHFLEESGLKRYELESLPNPDSVFHFSRRNQFTMSVEFSDSRINVYAKTDAEPILLFTKPLQVDISQNYIGLTAQSDRNVIALHIRGIEFHFNQDYKVEQNRKNSLGADATAGVYSPNRQYILRNPIYNQTILEILKRDTLKLEESNATIDDVLRIIEELDLSLLDAATFHDVNEFVTNSLVPISSKWQTRTLKLVERVKNARNVTGAANAYTNLMLSTLNSTLKESVIKASVKIFDLAELISESSDKGFDENGEVGDLEREVTKSGVAAWLNIAAVSEVVGLAIVATIISIPSVHRKIVGSLNLPAAFN